MQIHQLVHGYKKGHTQLSSTLKLSERDAELTTRLSDLSGRLSSTGRIPSYVTTYPLLDQNLYAVAKTWMDTEVSRSGCVITHTLLIPLTDWGKLRDHTVISGLLLKPQRIELSNFETPLALPLSQLMHTRQIDDCITYDTGEQFINKFFDQEISPIVWVDPAANSEQLMFRMLSRLWPALKGTITSCSYAIQPMTYVDKLFDWMFVSQAYVRNFDALSKKYFIAKNLRASTAGDAFWHKRMFDYLFQDRDENFLLSPATKELFDNLDASPRAIHYLFLLEKQLVLLKLHPTAAAGIFDLLDMIAPNQISLRQFKLRLCMQALQSISEVDDPSKTFLALQAIEEKLNRESFSNVRAEVSERFHECIVSLSLNTPEEFLNEIEVSLGARRQEVGSAITSGLATALLKLFRSDDFEMLRLQKYPNASKLLFSRQPDILNLFISETKLSEDEVRDWLSALIVTMEDPTNILLTLIRYFRVENQFTFNMIARCVTKTSLPLILDALAFETSFFSNPDCTELLMQNLGADFIDAIRYWCLQNTDLSAGVLKLLTKTYSQNSEGLKQIFKDCEGRPAEEQKILTAFIDKCSVNGEAPSWLIWELANNPSSVIPKLLSDPLSLSVSSHYLLVKVLETINSSNQLYFSDEHLKSIEEYEHFPFYDQLKYLCFRSSLFNLLLNKNDKFSEQIEKEHSWIQSCAMKASFQSLDEIFSQVLSVAPANVDQILLWLNKNLEWLLESDPGLLPELLNSLTFKVDTGWTGETTSLFLEVFRASRKSINPWQVDKLVNSSLRFCFRHTELPVSPIVIETFYYCYVKVIDSRSDNFLVDIFDWDKGKHLRKDLIRAFYYSSWPPGDLALAASEMKLLRKLVKRILLTMTNGDVYLNSMIVDLESRQSTDDIARTVTFLKNLAQNPSFTEDWF